MCASDRKRLGIPRLVLHNPFEGEKTPASPEPTIFAATIVGGGLNSISTRLTVILKPQTLGTMSEVRVEYVRGTDSTLSGSRDGLGPLLMYLQELRFGHSGIQDIFNRCQANKTTLMESLRAWGIKVKALHTSLDLVLEDIQLSEAARAELGLGRLHGNTYLATLQPSVTKQDVAKLARALGVPTKPKKTVYPWASTRADDFPIAEEITQTVKSIVDQLRVLGKISAGYLLDQAPYTALGPIIGNFLPLNIPSEWVVAHAQEILNQRKSSFGISPSDHDSFPACFTTGSIMGNRIGVHTALSQHPNAYFYYSSATHYSVKKVVRDSDTLTSLWQQGKRPRFSEIPADDYGRIHIQLLLEQIRKDQVYCASRGSKHEIILFANIGTTFAGGRDDIVGIRHALSSITAEISYIHVDGAFDLGFASDSVALGPPSLRTRNGLPVVQGLTLSNHKAYGIMVSGEVFCYNPTNRNIPTAFEVDGRIVFETWLFQQMYKPEDLLRIRQYCFDNSARLRRSLKAIHLATRCNESSMITLLERIPPWLVFEFHLAPEGEWVHYITMPHITPAAVDHFVVSVFRVDMHFHAVFQNLSPLFSEALGREVRLRRVRYHDSKLFAEVLAMAERSNNSEKGIFDLDAFKRKYIYSTVSFAAVAKDGTALAVFLAEASGEGKLTPGDVLFHTTFDEDQQVSKDIGRRVFESLAERTDFIIKE